MSGEIGLPADGINEIYEQIIAWMNFFHKERSQLYGIVINLMVELGKNDTTISFTDFKFSSDYRLNMTPAPEKEELKLHLERIK